MEQAVGRLGTHATGVTAWIGYEFLYLAALIAFAAAGQIAALRAEEADGYLDNLLGRHVSRDLAHRPPRIRGAVRPRHRPRHRRRRGWIGLATRTSEIGFGAMLQAGLNVAAPGVFVLGIGTLLYATLPRLAAPLLYGLVLWTFLVEIIGSSITTNHWLLDTAILTHLGPVPAADLDWTALGWLAGLGLLATLAGLALFQRRDLATA